jgi:hypothetical protein
MAIDAGILAAVSDSPNEMQQSDRLTILIKKQSLSGLADGVCEVLPASDSVFLNPQSM